MPVSRHGLDVCWNVTVYSRCETKLKKNKRWSNTSITTAFGNCHTY